MSQSDNNKRINGNLEPEIGRKLDYIFGKATGRQHNLDRSLSMLKALERIGLHDTSTSRIYLTKHFQQVFHNPESISSQNGNWVKRESLLAGHRGFLKVESTWNGNKLITIVLKGGTGG
jgi:hypothetical protein